MDRDDLCEDDGRPEPEPEPDFLLQEGRDREIAGENGVAAAEDVFGPSPDR